MRLAGLTFRFAGDLSACTTAHQPNRLVGIMLNPAISSVSFWPPLQEGEDARKCSPIACATGTCIGEWISRRSHLGVAMCSLRAGAAFGSALRSEIRPLSCDALLGSLSPFLSLFLSLSTTYASV